MSQLKGYQVLLYLLQLLKYPLLTPLAKSLMGFLQHLIKTFILMSL